VTYCSVDGCELEAHTKGMCNKHYSRMWRNGDLGLRRSPLVGKCSVDGCERKDEQKGMCVLHYARVYRNGDTTTLLRAPAGSGTVTRYGYRTHGEKTEKTLEHRMVCEKALGKPLPPTAVVHHVDENRLNNDPNNLVVCPSQTYHMLLHRRQDAFDACGHYDWRKCTYCKQHDDICNMKVSKRGEAFHAACVNKYCRDKRAKRVTA
jgi:hypothetical protein